jgi:hypothetical protein
VDVSFAVGESVVFTAQRCSVTRDHVQLTCTLGPGVGVRAQWTVTIANQTSSNPRTGYRRPIVASIEVIEGNMVSDSSQVLHSLDTRGGQTLVFKGDYFGPVEPQLTRVAVGKQPPAGIATSSPALYLQDHGIVSPHPTVPRLVV